jgi:hypothetical protein
MRQLSKRVLLAALALLAPALLVSDARAITLAELNLVDLLRESTSIIAGRVSSVTDGVDPSGLPYTEITVGIRETIRGSEQGSYTFRQFGLMEPRLSPDGTRMMLPAPAGIPRYKDGEEVLLFLAPPAEWTGLRSTFCLGTGRFVAGPGRIENDLANEGLFRNVSLEAAVQTTADGRLFATEVGAVNPDDFQSLVRRAVQGSWVETCQMWNTQTGKTCAGGGRPRQTPRVIREQ